MSNVCTVINIFKRKQNLDAQLNALQSQTSPIHEYMFWVNWQPSEWNAEEMKAYIDEQCKKHGIENYHVMYSYTNMGVWSRFYAAYNTQCFFVFILDDDVIPWAKWVEQCIDLYKEEPWIYGSRGSLFHSLENRFDRTVICESQNRPKEVIQVDISWHSRFFGRNMLPYMFDTFPEDFYPRAGEELWVSYRAAQYGLKTYIPPMTEDVETWGNKAPKLWLDQHANYNTEKDTYQKFYQYAVKHWFTPLQLKDE